MVFFILNVWRLELLEIKLVLHWKLVDKALAAANYCPRIGYSSQNPIIHQADRKKRNTILGNVSTTIIYPSFDFLLHNRNEEVFKMPTIQFRNKNKGVKKRTILQFIEFIFPTYEPRPSVEFHLGTSTRKNYCRVRGKRLWARKALALIWAFSLRHLFTLIEKQTAQIDQRVVLQLWRGGDPAERFKNWLGHGLPHFLGEIGLT